VTVLQRQLGGRRVRLERADRILWVWLLRLWGDWRHALVIVRPETVLRWHRRGFRLYWRWKSRPRRPGRPKVSREIRALVRKMADANPTWGAPRIHGELLKLGIAVSQSTVSKYLLRRRRPPSQGWRTLPVRGVSTSAYVDLTALSDVARNAAVEIPICRTPRNRARDTGRERPLVNWVWRERLPQAAVALPGRNFHERKFEAPLRVRYVGVKSNPAGRVVLGHLYGGPPSQGRCGLTVRTRRWKTGRDSPSYPGRVSRRCDDLDGSRTRLRP
jgi:hypothetical protein